MDDDSRVIPLSQLRGFRIANDALDMRLWQVHSGDGRWIGNVDELLVDAATMEVRYLDVEVENLLVTGRERHVLIPIDHARPDTERSGTVVVVDGLAARAVARLPAYDRGTVVRGTDAEYVRPFVAARNAGSRKKLDLPLRAALPRVFRPLAAASSLSASRDDSYRPAVIAAGAEQPAAATARNAGSRAA